MMRDIAAFNDDWLRAWSEKDVDRLLGFYTDDLFYLDPQVPAGLHGQDAFRDHLVRLFSSTPGMIFLADEVWPGERGYFGRWYCTIEGETRRLRGFDVIILRGDLIAHNEVYTHSL